MSTSLSDIQRMKDLAARITELEQRIAEVEAQRMAPPPQQPRLGLPKRVNG